MRLKLVFAFLAALVLSVGLSAQVPGGSNASGGSQKDTGKPAKKGDKPVKVVGCVSGGEKNGLLLTAQPGDLTAGVATQTRGAVPSVTYQLIGGDRNQLMQLMGKRAEIEGTTTGKPAASEKMKSEEEHQAKGTAGKAPKVETTEKMHMEVRKLNVTSARPMQGECPAAK
jgi:hypothetical protein